MNPRFYYGPADKFGARIERQADGASYVCCFLENDDAPWQFLCSSMDLGQIRAFANGCQQGWATRSSCEPSDTARVMQKGEGL